MLKSNKGLRSIVDSLENEIKYITDAKDGQVGLYHNSNKQRFCEITLIVVMVLISFRNRYANNNWTNTLHFEENILYVNPHKKYKSR